jgi:chromosome segregation ATPase
MNSTDYVAELEARIAELEAQINEYDDVVELAPGIISDLEMENWKLKFQVDGQATRIAELEAKLATMSELEEQHLLRIDELEAELQAVADWQTLVVGE